MAGQGGRRAGKGGGSRAGERAGRLGRPWTDRRACRRAPVPASPPTNSTGGRWTTPARAVAGVGARDLGLETMDMSPITCRASGKSGDIHNRQLRHSNADLRPRAQACLARSAQALEMCASRLPATGQGSDARRVLRSYEAPRVVRGVRGRPRTACRWIRPSECDRGAGRSLDRGFKRLLRLEVLAFSSCESAKKPAGDRSLAQMGAKINFCKCERPAGKEA